jgi:hypothetical protein
MSERKDRSARERERSSSNRRDGQSSSKKPEQHRGSEDINQPGQIDTKLSAFETKQVDEIIGKLEELKNKESVYNDTIIPDKILTKEEV